MQKVFSNVLILALLSVSNIAWTKSDREYVAQFLLAVQKGKTIKGDFMQTVYDRHSVLKNVTSGKFQVERPGKFFWKYRGNYAQKIISDGKRIWLEQPDLQQVSHMSLKKAIRSSPVALLLNADGIGKRYKIEPRRKDRAAGLDWVELTPYKDRGRYFENLFVGLRGKEIKHMRIIDSLGHSILVELLNVRFDVKLDGRVFNYEPPTEFDRL